jgi:hypothetical protein
MEHFLKNHNLLKAVAAATLALTAGFASAAGTQDLNVSATVLSVCTFTTGSAIAVTFTDIDPSTTGAKTKAISVPYKCTKGIAAPSVTVTSGGISLTGATTATTLAYSIGSWTTAVGAGFVAAAANATATATIGQADYQAAEADTYTETATISITP